MAHAEVIHFASHYVADERSPLLSKLLLADPGPGASPSPDSDGVLQAYEIYGMKLPRVRLVVLSACQTGVEQALRGEGAIGMARSFLSAGVPLVVASLWPVESDATAELMIKFHSYRWRDGLASAEALRARHDSDMIRDPDPAKSRPHAWASFVAYGGREELLGSGETVTIRRNNDVIPTRARAPGRHSPAGCGTQQWPTLGRQNKLFRRPLM